MVKEIIDGIKVPKKKSFKSVIEETIKQASETMNQGLTGDHEFFDYEIKKNKKKEKKESLEKLDIPEIILKNLIIIAHIDGKYDKKEKTIIKKFANKNSTLDKLVKFEEEFKLKTTTIDDINIPNNLNETYKIDLFVLAEEIVTADGEITDDEYNCLEKLAKKLQIKTVISHLLANLKKLTETNKKLLKINTELQQASEEIQTQNEEILRQKEILEEQKKILEEQKEEITSSIKYASRIQNAILPSEENVNKLLPENFILYKPRDIVSGDFYRCREKNGKIYFCVADCTGHGVPGAFMSMLGTAFLNEIVSKDQDLKANEILNQLREKVKETLGQTGKTGEQQDGMDITFCILDKETKHLQFAGANNHLYIIKNTILEGEDKLQMIKADKMPIGVYVKDASFNNKEINLETGDQLYLTTDGYQDQFGGENNEKFKTKNLKELLIKNSSKKMREQKAILDKEFEKRKGKHKQVDDITIMGVKI